MNGWGARELANWQHLNADYALPLRKLLGHLKRCFPSEENRYFYPSACASDTVNAGQ